MAFAFELPSATPPTPAVGERICDVGGVYTGVAMTTSFTITHNLGMSANDLAAGLPEVTFEPLLAAFWTEQPIVTSKTANTVVIAVTGTAATAFMRVHCKRPNTNDR